MAEGYEQQLEYSNRFFADVNTRIRDLEERHKLLRDKMLLVSETFVKAREKTFEENQKLKEEVEKLKSDNQRVKELLLMIGERLDKLARKEDVEILQRQFNMFRSKD